MPIHWQGSSTATISTLMTNMYEVQWHLEIESIVVGRKEAAVVRAVKKWLVTNPDNQWFRVKLQTVCDSELNHPQRQLCFYQLFSSPFSTDFALERWRPRCLRRRAWRGCPRCSSSHTCPPAVARPRGSSPCPRREPWGRSPRCSSVASGKRPSRILSPAPWRSSRSQEPHRYQAPDCKAQK